LVKIKVSKTGFEVEAVIGAISEIALKQLLQIKNLGGQTREITWTETLRVYRRFQGK